MVKVAVISRQLAVPDPFAPSESDSTLRRLATELHDGLVQDLFAARLEIDELLAAQNLPPETTERLRQLAGQLGESSNALRSIMHRLFHSESGTGGGGSVFERITAGVNEFADRSAITADLNVGGEGVEPGPAAGDLLVRAVREGLANVAKHARASQALVVVRTGLSWWAVEIADDGTGDPREVRQTITRPGGPSFGIASLADESNRLGGRLRVGSASRLGGIELSVSVPVGRGC